ncbi:glycosyltransferase [Vibrio fluvialis]|uniref:glycosyltransferase n=1 Tax=Vibrio fluvialis TaxID=676 RepID=UPI0028F6E2EC|nr:glycosyltransferase [Vibrio fluvialis]
MGSPKVSIYIPTHNRLNLLKRAVESVLNQSYKNIELIICDDGSSDGTYDYLKIIAANNIKILKNETPKGACYARNACIFSSTGEYITGLDDDDYFDPDRVNRLVASLKTVETNEPSFVYTGMIIKSKNGTLKKTAPRNVNLEDILKVNCIGNQVFCKTERLKSIGGFDQTLPAMQDYDLWIRLIEKYGSASGVNEFTYVHDITHDHERISKNSEKLKIAHEIIMRKNSENKLFNQELFLLNFYAYGFKGHKIGLIDCVKYIRYGAFKRSLRIWYATR